MDSARRGRDARGDDADAARGDAPRVFPIFLPGASSAPPQRPARALRQSSLTAGRSGAVETPGAGPSGPRGGTRSPAAVGAAEAPARRALGGFDAAAAAAPVQRSVRGTVRSDSPAAPHPFFAKRKTAAAPAARSSASPAPASRSPARARSAPWPTAHDTHVNSTPPATEATYVLPPGWKRRHALAERALILDARRLRASGPPPPEAAGAVTSTLDRRPRKIPGPELDRAAGGAERVASEAVLVAEGTSAGAHATATTPPQPPLSYLASELQLPPGQPVAPAIHAAYERATRMPPCSLSAYATGSGRQDGALWCDRWRPACAEHMLGNEASAVYLRDWLNEHRVCYEEHSGERAPRKRPVQTRTQPRKRGRPRLRPRGAEAAEFDSDEEAYFDQFRESGTPAAMPSGAEAAPEALTNCILLSGPTGSGKSAAVYACAAELGFDVFELYPGMGRRSGKELAAAVGQLGRNHMVGRDVARRTLADVLGAAHSTDRDRGSGGPRQSLILLEEVDVLFDEDAGFWPAVVELIAESRRPVVLTCMDASVVPVSELPLQKHLVWRSPDLAQGAVYLALVALNEGFVTTQAHMRALYQSTRASLAPALGRPDGPVHPACALYPPGRSEEPQTHAVYDEPAYDLRGALMQLQWCCLWTRAADALHHGKGKLTGPAPHAAGSGQAPDSQVEVGSNGDAPPDPLAGLRAACCLSECASLTDVSLSGHDSEDAPDVAASGTAALPPWNRAAVSPLPVAHTGRVPHAPSAARRWDAAMHEALLHSAYAASVPALAPAHAAQLEGAQLRALATRLETDRLAYSRRLDTFLALLNMAPGEQLPRAPASVEYAPYARLLLYIDEFRQRRWEQQIQAAEASLTQQGLAARATRNSVRLLLDATGQPLTAPMRWLPLGPAEIRAGRESAFL